MFFFVRWKPTANGFRGKEVACVCVCVVSLLVVKLFTGSVSNAASAALQRSQRT